MAFRSTRLGPSEPRKALRAPGFHSTRLVVANTVGAGSMALPRTIRNCRPVIAEPCPRKWEALTDTADPAVRHCESCGKSVFFCATDEETIAHARAGECVAREEPEPGDLGRMVLGRPSVPVVVTPEQMANRARLARERGINLY